MSQHEIRPPASADDLAEEIDRLIWENATLELVARVAATFTRKHIEYVDGLRAITRPLAKAGSLNETHLALIRTMLKAADDATHNAIQDYEQLEIACIHDAFGYGPPTLH